MCNDGVKFERKTQKISHCCTPSQKYVYDFEISWVVLRRIEKKCTKNQNARAQLLFSLIKHFVWRGSHCSLRNAKALKFKRVPLQNEEICRAQTW